MSQAQIPTPSETPDEATRRTPFHRRSAVRACALAVGLSLGVGGFAVAATEPGSGSTTSTTTAQVPQQRAPWAGGTGGTSGGYASGGTSGGTSGGYSSGGTTGGTTTTATAATAAQQTGVVTIDSTLGYEGAESAGTGIVLTAGGEVLTNNHVVEGATSIQVTVESTGRTYTAEVVGTDATDDIAVLQLTGASGLTPADVDTDGPSAGEAVTAVGNAGGTGDLVAAVGSITATDQSITTASEGSTQGESLSGLLEVDADIVAGDSGGPLLDADGEVVGIDTAASSGTVDVVGYAIPIDTALALAHQIESGDASSTVTLGLPAFLGVQLSPLSSSTSGALVAGVVDGGPAADAGLAAGDVVTAVDGTAVTSADELSAALAAHEPGDRVTLTWTDASGASQQATATLVGGPAA